MKNWTKRPSVDNRLVMPVVMPATARDPPKTAPPEPTRERKTPRQVVDLPRGFAAPGALTRPRSEVRSLFRPPKDSPGDCGLRVVERVSDSRQFPSPTSTTGPGRPDRRWVAPGRASPPSLRARRPTTAHADAG